MKNTRNFVYTNISTSGTIRAPLTSQDLSSDTKFSPSQSRVALPFKFHKGTVPQDLQSTPGLV